MGTWDIEDITDEEKENEPKMPDWYRPYMKNKVGWLNGIPQRPTTKDDMPRGRWK